MKKHMRKRTGKYASRLHTVSVEPQWFDQVSALLPAQSFETEIPYDREYKKSDVFRIYKRGHDTRTPVYLVVRQLGSEVNKSGNVAVLFFKLSFDGLYTHEHHHR